MGARQADSDGAFGVAVSGVAAGAGPTGGNLVANPSFEAGLTGWYAWHATATRVAGGQDGTWAASVAYQCPGGATCTSYTLNDSPPTVSRPAQGVTYTATAWVRAGTAGRSVRLVLREPRSR